MGLRRSCSPPPVHPEARKQFYRDRPMCENNLSPQIDYHGDLGAHFDAFDSYLRSCQDPNGLQAPADSRRQKLTYVKIQRFHEFSTDIYDELVRRKSDKEVPVFPCNDEMHPGRIRARQNLATLPVARFESLIRDVHFELGRRYPEFRERGESTVLPRAQASPEMTTLQTRIVSSSAASTTSDLDDIYEGPWLDFHRHLAACAMYRLRFCDGPINELIELSKLWAQWDVFSSLANYHSVVEILFEYLAQSSKDSQIPSLASRKQISEQLVEQLSKDLSSVLSRLVAILCNPNTYKLFLSHRGPHAQNLLDLVQDLLDLPCDHKSRPLLSKALVRLSRASGLHPTCFSLSGLQKVGDQVAAGGFGDIWKGLVEGHRVAVKVMRIFRDVDVKAALKEFGREAVIWRQLSHPNLLPFLGLYFLGSRLCLVSPWMEGGDLVRYLKDAPADTDRIALILDIATGLEYLHSVSVVHGDLKGTNILVTPSRRACIADFGLSSIVSVMSIRFTHSTANAPKGTLRWQAPELLSGKDVNHFGSDVYAFGCVCYEILSGNLPFNHLNEAAIMYAVLINKDRPRQPTPWPKTAVYNGIWALLEDCWNHDPRARPSAREIVQRLVAPPIGAKLTRATTDWDESYSSIFRRCVQQWRLLPSTTEIESRIFGDDSKGRSD